MADQFSNYGWTDIDWSFGENNVLRDTFYMRDAGNIEMLLNLLLGNVISQDAKITPASHPRFPSFYCKQVNIVPIDRKGVQNGVSTDSNWQEGLATAPNIVNGIKIMTEWAPMASYHVTEETWDFSAQSMAVIANAKSQDPTLAIKWQDGVTPCTSMQGVMKSIPKAELVQKKVLLAQVPSILRAACIGSVNQVAYDFMQSDQLTLRNWAANTLLCVGLPMVRKWHFDGTPRWEASVKMAGNLLQDNIVGPSGTTVKGQVTWEMLYRVEYDRWEEVKIGKNNTKLYPEQDFSQLANMQ